MKVKFRIKMITAKFDGAMGMLNRPKNFKFIGNGRDHITSDLYSILNIDDISSRYGGGSLKTGDMVKLVLPENTPLSGIVGNVEVDPFQ